MDWKRIEDEMPAPGTSVLAHYLNSHGNGRTVKACWVPAGFLEAGDSDDGEYDEERDEYYCPEGWYEIIENWDEYRCIAIHEGSVSHWMRLPAPPVSANQTEPAEASHP